MKTPRRLVPHSVKSLADEVKTSKSAIGFLLTGDRPVVTEHIAQGVSEAFGVPVDELFVPADSQSQEQEQCGESEGS